MNQLTENTQPAVAQQENTAGHGAPLVQSSSVATVANQHDEETNLQVQASTYDFEEYQRLVSEAEGLKNKKGKVSIVPKYYEFKTSLEEVMKNAEKKKGKEREQYLEMAIEDTKTQGFYEGVQEQDVSSIDKETGEVMTFKREVVRWIGAEGLYINFGKQLIGAFQRANVPLGTPVEIQFVREEKVKSKEGATVKIYEIYPLI